MSQKVPDHQENPATLMNELLQDFTSPASEDTTGPGLHR
jgi:hypothetical protein